MWTAIAGAWSSATGWTASGAIIASRRLKDFQRLIADMMNPKRSKPETATRQSTLKTGIERIIMKKIVIISQQARVNDNLIALLKALFPECDISVASADTQDFDQFRAGSFSKTGMREESET
jgi:hypothetical protein